MVIPKSAFWCNQHENNSTSEDAVKIFNMSIDMSLPRWDQQEEDLGAAAAPKAEEHEMSNFTREGPSINDS